MMHPVRRLRKGDWVEMALYILMVGLLMLSCCLLPLLDFFTKDESGRSRGYPPSIPFATRSPGSPPLTLQEAYALAEKQARAWKSSAIPDDMFVRMKCKEVEEWSGRVIFSFEARSSLFGLLFRRVYSLSVPVELETGKLEGFSVYEHPRFDYWYEDPPPPFDIREFKIGPMEALQIAEDAGGRQICESHPDALIKMYGSGGVWSIWYEPEEGKSYWCIFLSAQDGSVLER